MNNDLNNAFDNEVQIDNNPTSESSNIVNNNINESTSIPPVQVANNVSSENQNIVNTEENKTIDNNKVESNNVNVVNTSTKNNKKNNIMIPILVCVLVLVTVVGFGYYFIGNKSNKTSNGNTEIKKEEKKSEYRITSNSLENFDLYFLRLENNEKNMVYSPLSIKYALEMLEEGANGETKEQISNIIGDYEAKKYINSENMSFANAIFIRNTFKDSVKQEYTDLLLNKYNAEVILDDFKSANNINTWVSDKTLNLIDNLVDDVSGNDFFLINALAINMNWKNQIHCEGQHQIPCVNDGMYSIQYSHEKLYDDATSHYGVMEYPYIREEDFYGTYSTKNKFNGQENIKGATVLADFNKYDIIKELGEDKIKEIIKPEYEEWLKSELGKGDLPYDQFIDGFIKELKENYGKAANSTDFLVYEDDKAKVFAKDLQEYSDLTLQYVGIMPKEVELNEFIKNTNKDELTKIINSLKEVNINSFEEGYVTRIRGFIPFFKFEYELKLLEDLKKMGIEDIFDSEKADLSNLSDEKVVINKAIHKANIEFSNDGIKASASTAIGGYGAASGPHFEHLFKVPVKEIDVTFDKPYMYIIRDKNTGEVWFVGTVYEPIKLESSTN